MRVDHCPKRPDTDSPLTTTDSVTFRRFQLPPACRFIAAFPKPTTYWPVVRIGLRFNGAEVQWRSAVPAPILNEPSQYDSQNARVVTGLLWSVRFDVDNAPGRLREIDQQGLRRINERVVSGGVAGDESHVEA